MISSIPLQKTGMILSIPAAKVTWSEMYNMVWLKSLNNPSLSRLYSTLSNDHSTPVFIYSVAVEDNVLTSDSGRDKNNDSK